MRLLAALAVVAFAGAARPQTVADALRTNAKPLLATDLPDTYRAVALGTSGGEFSSLFMMGVGMGSMGARSSEDPKTKLLLRLIGATFVDPDEFSDLLEGKRPRIRAYVMDLGSMIASSGNSSQVPNPVFTETWIEANRIVQWSPRPDVTKAALIQTFGSTRPGEASDQGVDNVKQIALGIAMYSQDYDDVLPYANSTAEAQKKIGPYLKNDNLWMSPNGGRILYNTALSGVYLAALDKPFGTLLVWEEKPSSNGKRAVAYVDGHAALLDAPGWEQAWTNEGFRRRTMPKAAPARPSRPTGAPLPK